MFSCNQQSNKKSVLAKNIGLNLEEITFNEKPLDILKSKIDSGKNEESAFVEKGYSEPFDYPVGYKFEPWNDKDSFYGKAYYSKAVDSIAHYGDLYFDHLAFLEHNSKTVALLATVEVYSDSVYNNLVKKLNKQYGAPSFSPQTDVDVFYEWTSKDRYIQTDYYKGFSVAAMSDKKTEMKETFTIQLMIFNKQAGLEINNIQQKNYLKTKNYKVMPGDFKLYSQDPAKNLELANQLLSEKFK